MLTGLTKSGLMRALKEFIEGAVTREHTLAVLQEKANLERLFMLVLLGDTLGIPTPRPYYGLRLLPHLLRRITPWKRSLLRQRDWTDRAFD